MRFRVREVLLVSSPYDYFTLEEDGRINETILLEYKQLSLSYAPRITHVTTAEEALSALRERNYDLVITMSRVGEMLVHVFGNKAKEIQKNIPVVLLAYNTRELALFKTSEGIDLVFLGVKITPPGRTIVRNRSCLKWNNGCKLYPRVNLLIIN